MTGEEMKEIRERLGMSVTQFGIALGYSGNQNTISVSIRIYENGKRQIPPWIATAVRALDIPSLTDIIAMADRGRGDHFTIAEAVSKYLTAAVADR